MSEIPENQSELSMSPLSEASVLVHRLAEPRPAGDTTKAAIFRAYRRLSWSYNRVKDCWYADSRISISAKELDELRRISAEREANDARAILREAREIIARLEQCVRLSSSELDG